MRRSPRLAMMAVALPLLSAQSTLSPEERQLAQVKLKVAAFLTRMPDYTCAETIERSVKKSAADAPSFMDRLRVDIAYIGNQEVYSWPGAGKFEEKRLAELVGKGMVSDGDFALHTGSIFTRDGAQISFAGNEMLAGRNAAKYDYRVPSLSSAWTLRTASGSGRVGALGAFWIDIERLDLLRLELDAQDIPANLMIQSVHVKIVYADVRVHGSVISIPQSADTVLDEATGTRDVNHVDFTACREYHAESSISFDTEVKATETAPGTLRSISLPPNVILPLRFEQPIDSATAAQGDLIKATVERDVQVNGTVLIPRGASVKGRIRRMEKFDQPQPHFAFSLELTALEFGDHLTEIAGTLERIEPVHGSPITLIATRRAANVAGVGTLRIDGTRFHLDRNFHMMWRTIDQKR